MIVRSRARPLYPAAAIMFDVGIIVGAHKTATIANAIQGKLSKLLESAMEEHEFGMKDWGVFYHSKSDRMAQPLDCRVTFQLMRFRARSCIQNAACSQAAFSLLPRYKKHCGLEPRPRPGRGFRATSRPRARKKEHQSRGANPRELRGHLSIYPAFRFARALLRTSCALGSLRYEIILPCLFSCFLRGRQLINSYQTGTRVPILLLFLAICNPLHLSYRQRASHCWQTELGG
jgi:hypothetical protein